MRPAPGGARATKEGETKARIASEQRSAILRLLDEGPRVPWERHVYTYLRLAVAMHANAETVYNAWERDISDLARFIRQGVITLPNPDVFLQAADAARAGDGGEYRRIVKWLEKRPTIRGKLDAARKREREHPENLPGAVRDLVRRTQPREKTALEREAERLGLTVHDA